MTLRLGLMGGAFNPPHYGHLRPALAVADTLRLDRVLFIPSGQHPFKDETALAPVENRLEMTRRAIADQPRFDLSTIETDRPGTSYTIDTLRQLKAENPQAELFFLAGADLFKELHLWREWRGLLDEAHIHISARPGFEQELENSTAARELAAERVMNPDALKKDDQGRHRWLMRESTLVAISSTDVRERIRSGKPCNELVPDPVLAYIRENRLYLPTREV